MASLFLVPVDYSPLLKVERTSSLCQEGNLALHHYSQILDSQRHSYDCQTSNEGIRDARMLIVHLPHVAESGILGTLPLCEDHRKLGTYKDHNRVSILDYVLEMSLNIHEVMDGITASYEDLHTEQELRRKASCFTALIHHHFHSRFLHHCLQNRSQSSFGFNQRYSSQLGPGQPLLTEQFQ